MNQKTKAVLFSTLVLPGAGHYVLRRWLRGTVFLVPSLLALGFLVDYQIDRSLEAMEMVLTGEIAADRASIEKVLRKKPTSRQALVLNASLILLLTSWGGAAIDTYIQATKLDQE